MQHYTNGCNNQYQGSEDKITMNPNSEEYARGHGYQSNMYNFLISTVLPRALKFCNSCHCTMLKNGSACDSSCTCKPTCRCRLGETFTYKILDIGSGDGSSTNRLYKTLIREGIPKSRILIIGIDVLTNMTNYSRDKYETLITKRCKEGNVFNSITGLYFLTIDIAWNFNRIQEAFIQKFDLDTDKPVLLNFDQIVSSCVLHWVDDHPKALSNIKRLSSEKLGTCIDLIFSDRIVGSINYGVETIIHDPKWISYTYRLRKVHNNYLLPWRKPWMMKTNPIEFYKQEMIEVGFIEDHISIRQLKEFNNFKYGSRDEVKNFIKGIFPDTLQLGDMSETERAKFKELFFEDITSHMMSYNEKNDYHDALTMDIPQMYIHYYV